ncbi:uncharacterized protein AB675_9270 [Cyphellophora attinorum]|uniref:Uncharacterized protein n=1 Tax=Cyphellophora attinorum TaxID=1664694 RepID=A0A0N1P1B8_9EURO|nr:uncharacterized protein AB675_9270 [Phialophora attinorum]KPI41540.1 hypothetical protein AB675_9270 [Phialophora attinorum]
MAATNSIYRWQNMVLHSALVTDSLSLCIFGQALSQIRRWPTSDIVNFDLGRVNARVRLDRYKCTSSGAVGRVTTTSTHHTTIVALVFRFFCCSVFVTLGERDQAATSLMSSQGFTRAANT